MIVMSLFTVFWKRLAYVTVDSSQLICWFKKINFFSEVKISHKIFSCFDINNFKLCLLFISMSADKLVNVDTLLNADELMNINENETKFFCNETMTFEIHASKEQQINTSTACICLTCEKSRITELVTLMLELLWASDLSVDMIEVFS